VNNSLEENIKILFNKLNIPILDVTFIDKGINSIVYRIVSERGVYGLKICQYPERKTKVIKEVEIRNNFIDKGWDFIPESIHVDTEIFKNSAVIYKFIDGKKPDFSNCAILRQLAEILTQIHNEDLKIQPDGFSNAMKNYQSLKELISESIDKYDYLINKELKQSLIEASEEVKTNIVLRKHYFTNGLSSRLHGDLSDNFILDENGKLWLIDWENSIVNDTLEEIFFFMYINLKKEQEEFFIKKYKLAFESAKNIDFLNIKDAYMSLYPLFYICWNLNFIDTYLKNNIEIEEKYQALIESGSLTTKFLSKELTNSILSAIRASPIAKMVKSKENVS
jgi:thiamine kinase-like enzyme